MITNTSALVFAVAAIAVVLIGFSMYLSPWKQARPDPKQRWVGLAVMVGGSAVLALFLVFFTTIRGE